MRVRVRSRLSAVLSVAVVASALAAACASSAPTPVYNTTDPAAFAPRCLNPLHRSFKHCLDGTTVGGVSINGGADTIEVGTGEHYRLTVDAPPACPAVLKKGQSPCTVSIQWGVLYGASLADWGITVDRAIDANVVSGCDGNDRSCEFTVTPSSDGGSLPDGTALRVTAVANVVGLPCGKTLHGYCEHWLDWLYRFHGNNEALDVDWTMPARLSEDRAKTWSESSYGLAPLDYVDPTGWDVNLFVTDGHKPTCPAGVTFKWTVQGDGKTETLPDTGCKVSATVKSLGTYSVTAEEMKGGVADGVKATNDEVVVRDWLIVALGDSNGSGQGSPPYIYPQCDRSTTSHQYQVAQYLEDHDPRSSVTFVWASCSGARSDQLWRNTYEGQEPGQGSTLPPQLDQIEGRLTGSKRTVDAVVMSIGINDIFFGPIMGFCTTYGTNINTAQIGRTCESAHVTEKLDSQGYVSDYAQSDAAGAPTLQQKTEDWIGELKTDYRLLAKHLDELKPSHVFLTQYPDETTDAKGEICNGSGPRPHLESTVWSFLRKAGADLNQAVGATSSLGWTPVTGIAQEFTGHGYCSTDSYFRTVVASGLSQWNAYGSFHATPAGQAITFSHTRDAVCRALYGNPTCEGNPPAAR